MRTKLQATLALLSHPSNLLFMVTWRIVVLTSLAAGLLAVAGCGNTSSQGSASSASTTSAKAANDSNFVCKNCEVALTDAELAAAEPDVNQFVQCISTKPGMTYTRAAGLMGAGQSVVVNALAAGRGGFINGSEYVWFSGSLSATDSFLRSITAPTPLRDQTPSGKTLVINMTDQQRPYLDGFDPDQITAFSDCLRGRPLHSYGASGEPTDATTPTTSSTPSTGDTAGLTCGTVSSSGSYYGVSIPAGTAAITCDAARGVVTQWLERHRTHAAISDGTNSWFCADSDCTAGKNGMIRLSATDDL